MSYLRVIRCFPRAARVVFYFFILFFWMVADLDYVAILVFLLN